MKKTCDPGHKVELHLDEVNCWRMRTVKRGREDEERGEHENHRPDQGKQIVWMFHVTFSIK